MSPKAEHMPLLVNVGQLVRLVGNEKFHWKALAGHVGEVVGKAGPDLKGTGREHVIYHVKLVVPAVGFPAEVWVNRCDFERA